MNLVGVYFFNFLICYHLRKMGKRKDPLWGLKTYKYMKLWQYGHGL